MPYIDPKVVEEVKRVDLLTYLREENPYDLVRIGQDEYRLRSHDSLKISNGRWHWFSGVKRYPVKVIAERVQILQWPERGVQAKAEQAKDEPERGERV